MRCQELQAAVKAKDIAEKERNSAEAKAAGDKARYDYNMAYVPWLWLCAVQVLVLGAVREDTLMFSGHRFKIPCALVSDECLWAWSL